MITVRDLASYLRQNPGNAAVRALRSDLIGQGVPLDRLYKGKQEEYRPVPATLPPDQWLQASMKQVITSGQFDLSVAPNFVISGLAGYLKRAAGPDGALTSQAVRQTLGPRAQALFEMVADRMHAQVWETSASRALPALPPNLRGTVSENPRSYKIGFAPEVLREVHRNNPNRGMVRLTDDTQAAAVDAQYAAQLRRRNPQRRIAAHLGQPFTAPKMAALDALAKEASVTKPLKGSKLLVLQHLYGSTKSLLDAAVLAGVKPSDVTVMGKPYSGSMKVAAAMVDAGYNVVAPSLAQSEFDDHDRHMDGLIETEVKRLLAEPGTHTLLVIDDGGAVAKWAQTHLDEATRARFRFVEQTQRGATMVREAGVSMPVVNVAESQAKKVYESPSIGHSVFVEAQKKLQQLRAQGVTIEKELTLFGFGAVGEATARKFAALPPAERPTIYVYDPDPVKQAKAREAGFTVCATKQEALSHGHICIGATGREALQLSDYRYLPKSSVLFNAASANSELNAKNAICLQMMSGNLPASVPYETEPRVVYGRTGFFTMDTALLDEDEQLWDTFQGKDVALGKDVSATQIDRVVHTNDDQDLYFVRSGFVTNLTDDVDPIPPEYIGLTRALLFGALLQAKNEKGSGLVELAPSTQSRIVELTQAELAKTGQSLLAPTFSASPTPA